MIDKLMNLFETDIDKFIEQHNKLNLDFIKKDREENVKKDWYRLKPYCNPDFMLRFKLNLIENLKKND